MPPQHEYPDKLPVIVRNAIHESVYTEPEAARLLVKFYGAKAAARLILEGQQDVSLKSFLAHFFGLPSSHFSKASKEGSFLGVGEGWKVSHAAKANSG